MHGISEGGDIAHAVFEFVPTQNKNQLAIDFRQDARCRSLAGLQDRRAPLIQMHQIEGNRESFAHFAPFGLRPDSPMGDVTQGAVTSPCELQDRVPQLSNETAVSFVDTYQS